jgi:RimJ/RimL family protein N-acetyltransferase
MSSGLVSISTSKGLITTPRLLLRNWELSDLDDLHAVNSNPNVMRHFPTVMTKEETLAQLKRFQNHQDKEGFSYFAAELKETGECIGFIGMARQNYTAEFTPCVDIGWRLKESAWGKGYATEGAKACLEFAWNELKLQEVYAIAVPQNESSFHVMKKIGMHYYGDFFHQALVDYPELHRCKSYRIEAI